MSKVIKQMQIDALRATFGDVRDVVLLNITKLSAQSEHQLRVAMRKKNLRMQQVKNTFTRKVFGEMGIHIPADSPYWKGNTLFVWGQSSLSIAEISQAVDAELSGPKTAPLYKDKVTIKGAIADGTPVSFDVAKKMPTRVEAIGRVVTLILSAASNLMGQIKGPAGNVAGQIKSQGEEKKAEETPAEAPAS